MKGHHNHYFRNSDTTTDVEFHWVLAIIQNKQFYFRLFLSIISLQYLKKAMRWQHGSLQMKIPSIGEPTITYLKITSITPASYQKTFPDTSKSESNIERNVGALEQSRETTDLGCYNLVLRSIDRSTDRTWQRGRLTSFSRCKQTKFYLMRSHVITRFSSSNLLRVRGPRRLSRTLSI
jgi:hypothetical protein